MTPVSFKGQTHIMAEDQPEYMPLPAHIAEDGRMTCCWQLTWRERWQVLWSGSLWHQVLTFHHPLQPQLLMTERPPLP